MSFNPTTKTFSGTAPNAIGTNTITVSVNDGNGHTTSTNFNITVKSGNTVVGGGGTIANPYDYSTNTSGTDLSGTASADIFLGGSGGDKFQGLDGNDSIFGNDGNDRLYGGNGNDILYGGLGNDFLYGGVGNTGTIGDGSDTFVLELNKGFDTVFGFVNGSDRFGIIINVFTFGTGTASTDLTATTFGTGIKILAPSALGGAELMRVANFTLAQLDASDFRSISS